MRNIIKESIYHLKTETGWSYSYHGLFPFMWKADAPIGVIKLYHEIMKIEHIRKMDKLRELPKNERYTIKNTNDTE